MATSGAKTEIRASAADLYTQGRLNEAVQILSEQMMDGESAELWSDWGVIQASAGQLGDAERAFRKALRLNVTFTPAAENLGALLYAQQRREEAGPLLRLALKGAHEEQRGKLVKMLENCPLTESEETSKAKATPQFTRQERSFSENPEANKEPHGVVNKAATYEDWFEAAFRQRVPTPGARI